MHELKNIADRTDLKGVRVLLRSALNVPVEDNEVRDQFRLARGIATMRHLTEQGARVILLGHIGRDPNETLEPVYRELAHSLTLRFVPEVLGERVTEAVRELADGGILLLENVRSDTREQENDEGFARKLAELAEVFVNDAFADSHRNHASIVGLSKFLPSYAGINFMYECSELEKARVPESPSLFILGGAKFDTKIPLVTEFINRYDHVFITGALANDFYKAKGYEVGDSLVSSAAIKESGLLDHPKLLLPEDVTVARNNTVVVAAPDALQKGDRIVDAGPKTIAMLAPYIENAKTVLWNGPFGAYEQGFGKETKACAELVAKASGYSVVGGADTVASVADLNIQDQFNFLSTAGGAMLTFLETGTLPGIEALKESPADKMS